MYRRSNSDRAYLVLVIFMLVFGGGSLIALIYGPAALAASMPFLLLGAVLILLTWWVITAVAGRILRKEQEDHDIATRHIARLEESQSKDETESSGR